MSQLFTIFVTKEKKMLASVIKQIEQKIKRLSKGKILFITDFSELGTDVAIRQSLQRLTKKNLLIRLSQGIYYYPKQNDVLGIICPTAEQIAQAIAKRDKARIIPTGSYALYKLSLSTQIPMNVVYLTDGSARKIVVGKQKITFKKISPKNLAVKHHLSNLIIQGLKELGENNISENEKSKLKEVIIKSGEHTEIKKYIRNTAVWTQKIVLQIIKEIENN